MDIKRPPPKKTKQYVLTGVGIAALIGVTAWIANLDPAVPTIERSSLWTDSVRRGDMIRSVSAAGNLVPEHVRIISAMTTGRVEAVPLRPGAIVTPTTLLVELSNPELNVTILDYDQRLSSANQAHASLKAQMKSTLQSQESGVASAELAYREAVRAAALADSAIRPGLLMSRNDAIAARERRDDAKRRYDLARTQLEDLKVQQAEQLVLSEETVARTRAILEEQRRRALSLRVFAGESGVLQSINLTLGQYVNSGTELARIVKPELLKAVLRVPESQARDVAIGQSVEVDLHNNTKVRGTVSRIDPSAQSGTVNVDVAIAGPIPGGARADQSVDGVIEIQNLRNVLHVSRPVNGQPESTVSVFVLTPDGNEAVRKQVKLGKSSVSTVEVLDGLVAGDRIIIIDMDQYSGAQRVRIKG